MTFRSRDQPIYTSECAVPPSSVEKIDLPGEYSRLMRQNRNRYLSRDSAPKIYNMDSFPARLFTAYPHVLKASDQWRTRPCHLSAPVMVTTSARIVETHPST